MHQKRASDSAKSPANPQAVGSAPRATLTVRCGFDRACHSSTRKPGHSTHHTGSSAPLHGSTPPPVRLGLLPPVRAEMATGAELHYRIAPSTFRAAPPRSFRRPAAPLCRHNHGAALLSTPARVSLPVATSRPRQGWAHLWVRPSTSTARVALHRHRR